MTMCSYHRLLPATVHPPVSPRCAGRDDAGIAVAIANARRVRSSVDHAVRWGDESRRHDALSVLFPRAASIRSSQALDRKSPKSTVGATSSSINDVARVSPKSKAPNMRSLVSVSTPTYGERDALVCRNVSKKAIGSMSKTGLRRRMVKRASWLPLLPADVLERVVRMYASRATVTQLLQVARASEELGRAVVAVTDSTFELDERTLPNIGQWATIYRNKVRTLRIHKRLRRYPRDIVVSPLRTLITSHSLQDVTVPAIPILLRAVAYLPNLTSLGVYIRNREDAMTLLTMGGAVMNTAVMEGREAVQLACERRHFRELQLRSLHIHCVQSDDARDDPFCFTNACAVDYLTSGEMTTKQFGRTFSTVSKLGIHCYHRLLCDTGVLLNALPQLTEVELNTPADMTELTRETLFRMTRVHLCGVHEGPQVGTMLGSRVVCLRMGDMTLTAGMVSGLAGCTHLEELDMMIECGAERSLGNMSLTRLRKLGIRWVYNTVSMLSPETGRVCRIPRLHEACGRTLRRAVWKMEKLESLRLDCVRLDAGLIGRLLSRIGTRLEVLRTCLEGQKLSVDRQLDWIMRTIARYCPNVRKVSFREACSDCNWRYYASLSESRVNRLKSSLALVRSRAALLDIGDMEDAVAQLCGTNSDEHWCDWGA